MVTEAEAKIFVTELLIAFPAFDDAARNSANLAATHRSWAAAWLDLTLGECREVLRCLKIDGGIGWDDYRSPGPYIRRLAIDARKVRHQSERDREESQRRDERLYRRRDYSGSPMAAAMAAAVAARQAGDSHERVSATIEQAFPTADGDGPTYRCHICVDRGLVLVVRTDVAKRIERGDMPAAGIHSRHCYPVACCCGAGEQITDRRPMPKSGTMPAYSPSNFCRFHDDGRDADRITRWLADRRPANYDSSFDRYAG